MWRQVEACFPLKHREFFVESPRIAAINQTEKYNSSAETSINEKGMQVAKVNHDSAVLKKMFCDSTSSAVRSYLMLLLLLLILKCK
jgi:hypothetical protein